MIKKFAFVGHPSKDMEKAKQFYGELLGLKLDAEYTDKWTEFSAPDGKVIALDGYSPELSPEAGPFLALETDDIEQEVARMKTAGTPILKDIFDNGTCKMAIIQDPNGNNLMLHEIAPERCERKE
jgi:predicted enzyme related to lactoylglutathione lyase